MRFIYLAYFFADAHNKLGLALINIAEFEMAIYHLRKAIRINPDLENAKINLKKALSLKGNFN